jgi:uncharacterized membrane-anchored protein YhcB (DUF1043 family)
MEEVRNITYQPKTKDCIVCGAKFVYQRQTMQYCSNACKCKAYQTRQTNEQSIKRLKKIPGFQYTRSKQKEGPAQTLNGHQSIIDEQRQTINKQRAYIEHLHRQFDQFCDKVTNEFSTTRDYYNHIINEDKKLINELRNENNELRRNILSNENSIIAKGIGVLLNTTVKK